MRLSTLALVWHLALPAFALAQSGGTDVPLEGEDEGAKVAYPHEVRVEPAEYDVKDLLARWKRASGLEGLEKRGILTYVQEIWSFRGPKLAYYEKYVGKLDLVEPRARIEDVTISPESGRRQGIVFVVNHDDRFRIQGLQAFSSAAAELEATYLLHDQATLLLGPWWLERHGATFRYDGIASVETFEPARYDPPDESGAGGWIDYQPAKHRWHKVTAVPPEEFGGAVGDEVEFFFTTDDEPRLAAARFSYPARNYAFGEYVPTFLYLEFADVEGARLPQTIDVLVASGAERIERVRFSRLIFGGELTERELSRP